MIAFELTQNPGKDTNVRTRNFIVLKRVFMISAYPTSGSEYQCASLYEPWITWETSTRKWQSKKQASKAVSIGNIVKVPHIDREVSFGNRHLKISEPKDFLQKKLQIIAP